MNLNWALGVSDIAPRSIDIITANGQRSVVDIEALITDDIPKVQRSRRLLYEDDFSSWQAGSAHAYLNGLGMTLPQSCESRHEVFTLVTDKGVTVHVPALVLMRAFFQTKPSTVSSSICAGRH